VHHDHGRTALAWRKTVGHMHRAGERVAVGLECDVLLQGFPPGCTGTIAPDRAIKYTSTLLTNDKTNLGNA
jgi:hypothetical protein